MGSRYKLNIRTKRWLIASFFLVLAFTACLVLLNNQRYEVSIKKLASTNIQPVPSTSLKIDEYMRAFEKKGRFSGTVLAAKNGGIILSRGYGMADYELGVPNNPKTKFHLGSVTKQFTAMAIMKLEEEGKLSVNDALSKYIPDYPNGRDITIHNLLTHTSGIPDYINDDTSFASIARLYHPIEQVIDRFKGKPLEFKPGTRYDYSNSGYVLLSYIIQKVSGVSYEVFLKENIFKPLGMDDTGYDSSTPIIKNRAKGYCISSGCLINASFFDRSNLIGADGLYSTVEDLYTWDRALYTEKLVNSKTLGRIFTAYPPADTYGYGWTVSKNEISHYGLMDGYFTCIYRDISDKTAVIILSNIEQAPVRTICRDINLILDGGEYKFPDEFTTVNIGSGS